MTVKPNFFLVGAPKCGTTAMFEYLRAHPDIYMPGKELHYFGSDIVRNIHSLDEYLAVFNGWSGESRIGDASVWYLHSETTAQEIYDFNPDALILIMLRDPVEMMYSAYYELRYSLNEDLPTFEEALAAENDRRGGKRIPKTAHRIDGLLYREVASFTRQVRRYFDTFGREAVQVIIFDDFHKDTNGVYRDTLRFLGVDETFTVNFVPVNANKILVRPRLRRALRHLKRETRWYPAVRSVARRAMSGKLRKVVNERLRLAFTRVEKRPPMNPQLERELREEFAPEVAALGELLGRDLSHWSEPR